MFRPWRRRPPGRLFSPGVVLAAALVAALLALPGAGSAQAISQRGFLEARATVYPQAAVTGDRQAIGDALFREEVFSKPAAWLTLAGAVDARVDSQDRVARAWSIDWNDRGLRRPPLAVRRLSVAARRGGVTVEIGKQFVRWGKADVLNPTDRFAPRDFLEVVDNEVLAVTAARLTWERGPDSVDLVWVPRFTPSRLPLAGRRWAVSQAPVPGPLSPGSGLSGGLTAPPIDDLGAVYPSRGQVGVRWNRAGSGLDYSLSFFDGFNHLPRFDFAWASDSSSMTAVRRYPSLRMYGGDVAWPLRWVTVKGEAAYFTTSDAASDDYGIYVLQLERQRGEWTFVGGYAGEVVTARRATAQSAPGLVDRGLARTFLGRAACTIDVARSVAFEGAVRRDGGGLWLRTEYSQAAGRHWRLTARVTLLRGSPDDVLGQYRRNSNIQLFLRYSY